VWLAALAGVAVTAWYATRLLLRTFFGAARAEAEGGTIGVHEVRPHDPPPTMRWPVILLAIPAALLGLVAFLPAFRAALELESPHLGAPVLLPMGLLALGAGGAWWMWQASPATDPADALGPLRPVFAAGFYLDEVQDRLVVRPVRALAGLLKTMDERVVDAAVEGTGTTTTRLGALVDAAHRATLPRAAAAVFTGALLLGVVAAWWGAAS
jgi:NADH-quinone oxidoreductase subunit L